MKTDKAWNPDEIFRLQGPEDTSTIAKILGRSSDSVRSKRREIRLRGFPEEARVPIVGQIVHTGVSKECPWSDLVSGAPSTFASASLGRLDEIAKEDKEKQVPPTYEQDRENKGQTHWQSQYQALEKKYEKALLETSATERLVSLAASLAPTKYSPLPPVVREVIAGSGKPQSAVLLLTDCHVGLVVTPEQTLGFGEYNFAVFLARLKFLEESVISILQNHTNTEVPELVLCLGGDILDGALNHGAEAAQQNTLFTQFYSASHALSQFLQNISAHFPKVRVFCTCGNHTRWSHQKRMPTTNRFSNLDAFLYAHMQALTKDLTNVEWILDQQPFSLFEIQGFMFQLLHGDTLRGGDKALGVPNHSIGRMVSSSSQMFGKFGKRSPDYFLTGHLHREISLPTAKGSVLVGGGFPGIDGFGLASGFVPVDPSQLFFFMHPVFGTTAKYSISLKFAKVSKNPPYSIPGDFDIE